MTPRWLLDLPYRLNMTWINRMIWKTKVFKSRLPRSKWVHICSILQKRLQATIEDYYWFNLECIRRMIYHRSRTDYNCILHSWSADLTISKNRENQFLGIGELQCPKGMIGKDPFLTRLPQWLGWRQKRRAVGETLMIMRRLCTPCYHVNIISITFHEIEWSICFRSWKSPEWKKALPRVVSMCSGTMVPRTNILEGR